MAKGRPNHRGEPKPLALVIYDREMRALQQDVRDLQNTLNLLGILTAAAAATTETAGVASPSASTPVPSVLAVAGRSRDRALREDALANNWFSNFQRACAAKRKEVIVISDDEDSGPSKAPVARVSLGCEDTPAKALKPFQPFFHIPLADLTDLYRRVHSEELFRDGSSLDSVHRILAVMEGLEHGIANFLADPDEDLPPRSDPDYARKRRRIQTRLLWTRKAAPPIPGPLLFYRLTILRGVRLDQVPSDAQESSIQRIEGGWAESPGVITGDGVCKLSKLEPGQAFWGWLRDLCQFAVEKGNFKKTLGMAARCRKAYAEKCLANGDVDESLDSDGSTAQLMLRENTHSSCLFLGISKRELQLLFKFLPCVMEGKADEQTMTYLKDISNTLSVHL